MDLLTFPGVTAQMLTTHGYVFLRTTFFADVMVEGNCSNWATCLQLFASVWLLEGKALDKWSYIVEEKWLLLRHVCGNYTKTQKCVQINELFNKIWFLFCFVFLFLFLTFLQDVNPFDATAGYRNLTYEEVLQELVKHKEQLKKKDTHIRELEDYIDNLLVRVMEETPSILRVPYEPSRKAGKFSKS